MLKIRKNRERESFRMSEYDDEIESELEDD
jgi:hypothetical protein